MRAGVPSAQRRAARAARVARDARRADAHCHSRGAALRRLVRSRAASRRVSIVQFCVLCVRVYSNSKLTSYITSRYCTLLGVHFLVQRGDSLSA